MKQRGVSELTKVGVVIPTLNAAGSFNLLCDALAAQKIAPEQVLIVDSSSVDETRALARAAGFNVLRISLEDFSHGGTRRLASEQMPWAEVLIFLTQDALPADRHAFRRLVASFRSPVIGAAYGRQLPRREAGLIERHARLFNYPSVSSVQTYSDKERSGLKAAFISNSFAAYRVSALNRVGGFPSVSIVGEDSIVACKMLMADYKIAYVAEASVYHSHNFSPRNEFARYFDIGVHHAKDSWILSQFGKANNEGMRFLKSEFRYLFSNNPLLIPVAMLRTAIKLTAYQIGRQEARIPWFLKSALSAQPTFWMQMRKRPLKSESHGSKSEEFHRTWPGATEKSY